VFTLKLQYTVSEFRSRAVTPKLNRVYLPHLNHIHPITIITKAICFSNKLNKNAIKTTHSQHTVAIWTEPPRSYGEVVAMGRRWGHKFSCFIAKGMVILSQGNTGF
jgi:hypothetical protein